MKVQKCPRDLFRGGHGRDECRGIGTAEAGGLVKARVAEVGAAGVRDDLEEKSGGCLGNIATFWC